jgi:hypothetical protein
MELIEIIVCVVAGFLPMLGGLELASRKLRHSSKIELKTDIRRGEKI